MSETLITVENVSKKFCRDLKTSLLYGMFDLANDIIGKKPQKKKQLRKDEFWAVEDVSFSVKRGESIGLIGRNGAGKSTLLKMLNGIIKPDSGRIEMRGKSAALIELGAGFNPILTGRENIYINAAVLGISKKATDEIFDEIVDFSELGEFIDTPVQYYSSGMKVRLGFSIASTLKPDVLILDEVLAVGDANFRSKCWTRIGKMLENTAVILVSHEAYAISRICDRAILLESGRKIIDSSSYLALAHYAGYRNDTSFQIISSKHEKVSNFSTKLSSNPVIKAGDYLQFQIKLELIDSLSIDHWVINIIDKSDLVHGQSLVDYNKESYNKGTYDLNVKIGPLYLSKGTYTLMILISTNGGKTPLIHSKGEIFFNFDGNLNFGPSYYPPGKAKIEQIN